MRFAIQAVVAFGVATMLAAPAQAVVIQASLSTPIAAPGATTVIIAAPAVGAASASTGAYTLAIATLASQGVVHGSASGLYALPVAGVSGGTQQYLTAGFGSALTASVAASGNYFSTGQSGGSPAGTVTVTFTAAQGALALLWGSIDATNQIVFRNGAATIATVTGQDILNAVPGISAGSQGAGGSAYVPISAIGSFTSAVFSSGVTSFEFAGVAGASLPFVVPEPASLLLLAGGLAALAATVRARRPGSRRPLPARAR